MLLSFAFALGLFSGPTPIVARIDHVIIQAPDPKPLFTLLTDVFELPVAWPLQSYGVFTSGGVFVGNVNIEIMQGTAAAAEWAHESPGPRLHGIAFEPHESAAESVTLLKKRSVGHSLPAPFFGVRNGKRSLMWTTVFLHDLEPRDALLLVCDYAWDVEQRRKPLRTQLEERDGGQLGIRAVARVIVAVSDLGHATRWDAVLAPHRRSNNTWHFSAGPAFELIQDKRPGLIEVVVAVKSIDRVRQVLAKRHDVILRSQHGKHYLSGSLLGDLRLQLSERSDR